MTKSNFGKVSLAYTSTSQPMIKGSCCCSLPRSGKTKHSPDVGEDFKDFKASLPPVPICTLSHVHLIFPAFQTAHSIWGKETCGVVLEPSRPTWRVSPLVLRFLGQLAPLQRSAVRPYSLPLSDFQVPALLRGRAFCSCANQKLLLPLAAAIYTTTCIAAPSPARTHRCNHPQPPYSSSLNLSEL